MGNTRLTAICLQLSAFLFRGLLEIYFVADSVIAVSSGPLQTELLHQIIGTHFRDCYVVEFRKRTNYEDFRTAALTVPSIQVNYNKMDHSRIFNYFTTASRYGLLIKHNQQCIIYCISLTGFTTNNIEDLLAFFQIKALQIEATYSYLLISDYDSNEIFKAFIMSTKLKNFPHRVHVQSVSETIQSGFQWVRFCPFCVNGNPGILYETKVFSDAGDIYDFDEVFPDMVKNFNGKVMRVVAPQAPPLVVIAPSKTQAGKNEIYGQQANILNSLSVYFNFSYTLYVSPLTGIKLPNGTWNGIMGEILYDRADIGLSVATSYDRYQIIDVTISVFYAFLVLVSTKPTPTFEWQAIFYPFQTNCWLAFIFSIALTFFVSKWLHNTSIQYEVPLALKGKSKIDIVNKLRAEFLTNYKSFYITVGNLLEQGPPFDFNTTPSRMFITFWMFFSMIITTAYRSKLFTFLTFPTVAVPPSTFLELVGSKYKWGMKHLGGIAFEFITKSPLSYVRTIGEGMQVYNDKYTCLDRTFRDRFTCIIYKAYIDYMMEIRYWKLRHNFHISDFVSPPVGSSWVLPKHAPWLSAFNTASFPIYEMGLADKYLYDYQISIAKVIRARAQDPNSTQDTFGLNTNFKVDDDGPKPLVMANLYAAFFILLFGIAIGAVFIALEVIRENKYSQSLREKQLKLKIHLRRKLLQRKKELHMKRRQPLSFQQVVKVIGPNTHDILETDGRTQKNKIFTTVATLRTTKVQQY